LDPDPSNYLIHNILFSSSDFWPITLGILILILLVAGSALISASEVALFSLKPIDLKKLEESHPASYIKIERLREKPKYLLATILISNNFINIAIVIISYFIVSKLLPPDVFRSIALEIVELLNLSPQRVEGIDSGINFIITTAGITFLLVLFGEVSPKIYANLNNIKHSRLMASPLLFLEKVYRPLSGLLVIWSSRIESNIYEKRLTATAKYTDKKELDAAIELAVSSDQNGEIDILKGIINFGDVTAKQIMKSRVDVISIDESNDFHQVMQIVRDSGFSRIPVYSEDFDNIKGILYVKDLLGYTEEKATFKWAKLIRNTVLYVPESKKIYDLLREFQAKRTHMGIVVDEYGGSAGVITLEDIMEEVIGDIKDEFDQEEEPFYTKIDDHNYIFEGKTLINDVIRILELDKDIFDQVRGTADSIAGLIIELTGSIPHVDKEIKFKHLRFKIVSVSKRRIEKVNIHI
jgi:gliding motility-associated protein GldE